MIQFFLGAAITINFCIADFFLLSETFLIKTIALWQQQWQPVGL
jgi:hypothetical protein